MWLLALWACVAPEDDRPPGDDDAGLLGELYADPVGQGRMNPFPSAHLVDDDGRIFIPEDRLPVLPTRLPLEQLRWRTGFSPAQVVTLRMPGLKSSASLPGWRRPEPGVGTVKLADLTDGVWWPVMAEFDAYPEAEDPTLLIRPLAAMPVGHQMAVVVTTDVVDRPDRFDGLLTENAPDDLVGWEDHYTGLVSALEALGQSADEIALAWDFPIGDGTRPLISALEQLEVPDTWAVDLERNFEDGDSVGQYTYRYAEGTFTAQSFLDDLFLNMNEDGSVSPTGTEAVDFYVHIPRSVADAEAGTIPVVLYGHGMNGRPDFDLNSTGPAARLSEELGAIIVAVAWRGLDWDDRVVSIGAANDFGIFPAVPERMSQGQVEMRMLAEMVSTTAFSQDPVFQGRQGQDLINPDQILFYGVSMGGVEGGVFMANDPPAKAAVLQVPGAAWSTMLERSSAWVLFETIIVDALPRPEIRQQLYSVSQLWFDLVDPIAYTDQLLDKPILVQEAIGDDTVHNIGTEMLARSVQLPLLSPSANSPYDLASVDADLPPGSRALVQFDPDLPIPENVNRPAEQTGSHVVTINWFGMRQQAIDFLTEDVEGQVNHYCGDAVCSRSNPGSPD